jgi:hypothetical protein
MKINNDFVRLSKAARVYNISIDTIVSFLASKGINIIRHPNTKLDLWVYDILESEFGENDNSENDNWVKAEYIPDDYYLRRDIPEVVSIWDIITDSAKKRFDYSEFENDFDEGYNHIPHNLIRLIISGFASEKTNIEIVATLFTEMLMIGLKWDKEDIKEFIKDKDIIFEDEIKIARKTNEMLKKGIKPESVLDTLVEFIQRLDYS